MIDWVDAIIKSLKDLGGKGTNQQIYEQIKKHVALDPPLLKMYYGNIRYHNRVRSHLSMLRKKGIIKTSEDGLQELVEQK